MNLNTLTISVPLTFKDLVAEDGKKKFAFISYAHQTFSADTTMSVTLSEDFLGLHFNLGKRHHYHIAGYTETLKTNQYNLMYIPSTHYEVSVEKGVYTSLDIQYPVLYLLLMENHFAVLKKFLAKVRSRELCTLTAKHMTISREIQKKIQEILFHKWTGFCRETYLNAKVLDILLACLHAITNRNEYEAVTVAAASEVEKVKLAAAKKYLEDNYNQRLDVALIAWKIEMDSDRLRVIFKNHFRISMMHFIMRERVKKAMALLRDSTMTIEKIAKRVGFKKHSHFSAVFKKDRGYNPREWRKMRDENQSQVTK